MVNVDHRERTAPSSPPATKALSIRGHLGRLSTVLAARGRDSLATGRVTAGTGQLRRYAAVLAAAAALGTAGASPALASATHPAVVRPNATHRLIANHTGERRTAAAPRTAPVPGQPAPAAVAPPAAARPTPPPAAPPRPAPARPAPPAANQLSPHGAAAGQLGFVPDRWQMRNARAIIQAGQDLRLAPRAWVIALATACQESGMHNLGSLGSANDHDSLGLFQQRPSSGWGTPAQVTNAHHAATSFYRSLVHVSGWNRLPLTVAAQRVQVSAFPAAYAKWEQQAINLVLAWYGVGPYGSLPAAP